MNTDLLITIILFSGFNEVSLPKNAMLYDSDVNGYEVSLRFKAEQDNEIEYRQFYVSFNNVPTDYNEGILHLLRTFQFTDGTSSAMVYEVYPYESSKSN
ncbi:hypothetical protein [Spirosoma sp. KNUC1025]|uniref:hypothetical protein n=1 Tax=Spirosoma sp. KNUC1025 TaxID=2894082 RepID=UPI00386BCE84|nr:hypothetical protein LN737_01525 [Spirosoma sp. KNUC1025]